MAQSLTLKIKGLYTSLNELSEVPEGALLRADNIDILKDSIAEPRRGFERLSAGYSDSSHRTDRTWFFQDKQFAHHGATLGSATTVSYLSGGAWTSVGSFAAPTGAKIRNLLANQNCYFTTSAGVRKLDAYNATSTLAGAYKALDLTTAVSSSSSTWLADTYAVAYRLVWGIKDANGNVVLGAPSQREVFTNNAGSQKAVDVTATIPSGITTAWFYQLYRSAAVDNSSGDAEPSDELGLVYEGNPSSAEITAGSLTITDIVPDALRGATIYTAASQEGLANQNERPPLCKDFAVFRDTVFFANTTSKHRFYLTLLSVGSSAGVQADDTVTIGGVTYTAKNAETVASAQFRAYAAGSFTFADADVNTGDDTITENGHPLQDGDAVTVSNSGGALPGGLAAATTYYVVSRAANTFKLATTKGGAAVDITSAAGGGTHTLTYGGSASQNIRNTALSLVRVINQYSSSTVYAYYLSGVDDLPGKILLEERSIGGAAFGVASSRTTCWNPTLTSTESDNESENDNFKNGLQWSKQFQPESAPLPNFVQVGSKDSAILRIIPLKDALLIFKEDGIYRLTGYYPSFTVELFDSSAVLLAAESAAVLNNQIFCLTDQGVTVVSDGVKVISRPIEQDLLQLFGASLSDVRTTSWGIGYETDRKYYLFMVSAAGETAPTQAFVYNVFTNTWVRHTLRSSCGVVEENRLYIADSASNYILKDRKSYSYLDYADFAAAATITAINGSVISLSAGTDLVAAGDILYQSSTVFSIITAVDSINSTVTVQTNPGFAASSADLLKAIDCDMQWAPITTGNPAIQKHYHTVALIFKTDFQGTGYVTFSSDLSQFDESVPLTGTSLGAWGLFNWGQAPWGGESLKRPIRQWIPLAKQRSSQLTVSFQHSYGFSSWQLQGISVFGEPGTERFSR